MNFIELCGFPVTIGLFHKTQSTRPVCLLLLGEDEADNRQYDLYIMGRSDSCVGVV